MITNDAEREFFGKPLESDECPPTSRCPETEPMNTRAKERVDRNFDDLLLELTTAFALPEPFERLIHRGQTWNVSGYEVQTRDLEGFITLDGVELTRDEAQALSMALLEASGAVRT